MPEIYVVMMKHFDTITDRIYDRRRAIFWPGVGVFTYKLRITGKDGRSGELQFAARRLQYKKPDDPYARLATAAAIDGLQGMGATRITYVKDASFETAKPPENFRQLKELMDLKSAVEYS